MSQEDFSEIIQRRIEVLRESGEFGLDDAGLRAAAEELYDQELRSKFTLTGDEIFQALVTVFKGKSFLRRGKRHIGMAFFPEPGILAMEPKKLAAAVAFIESETFKLERRDRRYHTEKCCVAITIGFQWVESHKQFYFIPV